MKRNKNSRSSERREIIRDLIEGGSVSTWIGPPPNRTEVFEALNRVDNGKYGICINCGKEIPEARLHAKPEATRCIDCQILLEQEYVATMGSGSHIVGSSLCQSEL